MNKCPITIESIQQEVDAISAISDKIIYLINYRADFILEYNPENVPKPENPLKWHIQTYEYRIVEQIDLLIEKYDQLLKYQTVQPTPTPIRITPFDSPDPEAHEQKPFDALKIKAKYDPEKVYKEFKTYLKCEPETFNDWFVYGKVSDKKMKWTFEKGNKTQLRSFLFALCGGWSPKNTNKAFEITVDSNDRQNNLNDKLVEKLKKCIK